jgi:2-dehydro-3-deoxygluconokinase
MNKSKVLFEQLQKDRLIALLTPRSTEECVRVYEICREQGVILEIAFRSDAACEGIRAVLSADPEALILAGTVLTAEQAGQAIDAGAAGIVSADYIPEVVETCVRKDIMCVPGGLSDAGKQLVLKSRLYGCSLEELRLKYPFQWVYKLFPAFEEGESRMGLAKAWKEPIKGLQIIYTGGINRETIREAFRQDPEGIFCGSALTKNADDPDRMISEIQSWKTTVGGKPESPQKSRKPSSEKGVVVTFGEIMARLSSPDGVRIRRASSLEVNFGGAEANVAVSLARFGRPSRFVTVLPNGDLGDAADDHLRVFGVDTSRIIRKRGRLGLYFLEKGSGQRPARVIYDRAGSAFSELNPREIDWDYVFKDAVWFHWTGITPALGSNVFKALYEGLERARAKGITISADLNFRKKLWTEEQARESMTNLMPFVDIMIGNEEDPARVFGMQMDGADLKSGHIHEEGYRMLTKELVDRFGFRKVAVSLRESLSASENNWSACFFNGREFLLGPKYHVNVVDRIGSGDAFAAGLIYGLLDGKSDPDALAFSVASACLKHSVRGDFNDVNLDEVERLASGETSGRVKR